MNSNYERQNTTESKSKNIAPKGVLYNIVLIINSRKYIFFYLWVLHPVAHLSNWFFMMPSVATKFQYVNSLLFSFSLTTCFGPYGPSSGEIYNQILD
jgi:hypothetical protein